jgi:nitrous oxide reductase accessory protein NosL
MKYQKICTVIIIAIVVVSLSGISRAIDFIQPTEKDKCPVCGMFVYKYPKWIAEIIFEDGSYAVFDGPKDMFKYYFNASKYNKHRTKEDISAVYVTEYYTTKTMKAEDVYFIVGSDVYGPMGVELIPIKGEAEAHTFMKDHKGKKMLRFSEITPADVPGMMHKHKTMHDEGHEMHESK